MAAYAAGRTGNTRGPGRPRGALNKRTIAAIELERSFTEHPEEIFAAIRASALAGDASAQRLFLDRALPLRRGRPILVDLPPIKGAKDVALASRALLEAVASGGLTPAEAVDVAKVLEAHVEALKVSELADRLAAIEANAERSERDHET